MNFLKKTNNKVEEFEGKKEELNEKQSTQVCGGGHRFEDDVEYKGQYNSVRSSS